MLFAEDAMSAITIDLPEDRLLKLQEVAARLNVTPEELVRVSVDELLDRPDDAFERALDHVLRKNQELYRRLA
jgi:predicted transcriptional regulator